MELLRRWGVAENGESVEVALAPNLAAELDRRWPSRSLERSTEPVGAVRARFGLSDRWLCVPDHEPAGTDPPVEAWDLLQSELTLFAVRRLTRLVPIHSAAIAWNGRVLMVPTRSGGGKSTLAIAAHAAGAGVLSDEYTLVDPGNGRVTGWDRPVRRRNADGTTTLLDLTEPSEPLPVGLVALVRYEPGIDGLDGAARRPIPTADAIVELLSHTLTTRSRPDDTFDAVVALSRASPAFRGRRGEAAQAIVELLAMMDDAAV